MNDDFKDTYKKIGNIVEMVDCTYYKATEKDIASWGFGYYPSWPAGGIIKFRHENGWSEWEWMGELPKEMKLSTVEVSHSDVIKYDRIKGVPQGHYMLMKVDCFGEMGGPSYSDRVLYHSPSEEQLINFCKDKKIKLKDPSGWNEYFITRNENE